MTRSWGVVLLALYLILRGLMTLTNFSIVYAAIVLGALALSAGVCLLLGK